MASSILKSLCGAIIVLWILAFLQGAVSAVTVFDGPLWNGAFQHLNALRRIDAGQTGGVQFQFFHGLLLPYLHYPFYRLLGGDLFASEAARFGINLAAFVIPFFLVFRGAFPSNAQAIGLTAAALALAEPLGLQYLAWPSHNTPGVRAAAPFLLLGLLLADWRPRREAIAAGILLGMGFVLGTEHGIAMAFMLGATWVCRWLSGAGRVAWHLALTGIVGVATALGLLLAVGGWEGAKGALRYALVAIPEDQFWYFGSPPLPYLENWGQVFSDRRLIAVMGVAITQMAALLHLSRRLACAKRVGPPLFGALVYGIVASVGYLSYTGYHFFLPLIRIELTAALILATILAIKVISDTPRLGPASRAVLFGLAATVLLAGPIQEYGSSSLVRAPAMIESIGEGARAFAAGECRLSEGHDSHLNAICQAIDGNRIRSGLPTIWSEYAGLVEAHYGIYHPAQDYIIHARGRNGSNDYLAAFRKADTEFAFTFHAGYFAHVEKLQASDWGFYEELYLNYELLTRTRVGCLWKRLPGPWKTPAEESWFPLSLESRELFFLPEEHHEGGGVYIIDVEYEIVPSLASRLPIVGSSPRYMIYICETHTQTPISLRPYNQRVQFPVILAPGRRGACAAISRSLIGGEWKMKAVRARPAEPDVARKYRQSMRK